MKHALPVIRIAAFLLTGSYVAGEQNRLSSEALSAKALGLIAQLGDEHVEKRNEAERVLLEMGDAVRPQVQKATTDPDLEISARAAWICMELDRNRRVAPLEDPALKKKAFDLLEQNPGKSLLVIKVLRLKETEFLPVKGLTVQIMLQRNEEPPRSGDDRRSVFPTDESGAAFCLIEPGDYHIYGYGCGTQPNALAAGTENLTSRWRDLQKKVRVGMERVCELNAIEFVPPMEWTALEPTSQVSLRADPSVAWKPYPGVKRVSLNISKMTNEGRSQQGIGFVPIQEAPSHALPLTQILKHAKEAVSPGDQIRLQLTGYDAVGQIVSANSVGLTFHLSE